MNKKILQFSYSFSDNKIPPQSIAKILSAKGVTSSIYYLIESSHSDNEMSQFNQCDSKSFGQPKGANKLWKLRSLKNLFNHLKSQHYDIIITHRYKPFFMTLLLSCFFTQTEFYAIFHGNGSFKHFMRKLLCRYLLHKKWHLIAVSEAVKTDIVNSLGQTDAEILVIYNCLDMTEIHRQQLSRLEARQALNISQDQFIIGCTARLVAGKGLNYLLDAMAKLKTSTKSQLAIIGDGCEKDKLMLQAQQQGIMDRVIFCGYRHNAFRYAAAFDLFTLPSTNEAFGVVLLEAAAARIPLITTTAGGMPEVAENTEIIQVSVKDSSALAESIDRIIDMPLTERQELGHRIYQQLYNKFDISQIAPDYYKLFQLDEI